MEQILESLNIENSIKKELKKFLPNHESSLGYDWAMFPAGKLFRPILTLSVALDIKQNLSAIDTENLLLLASALESHHSYSLVHDDLPAMDNDNFRRGKESTHKKFGEWQAILIGDGLLNVSYQFLSKIKGIELKRYQLLLKVFSNFLGPKGLIHGQYLDLSHEMTKSFNNTILTHKLKTGRLIQVAMISPAFILLPSHNSIEKTLWKTGENIGILFQLLDDLSELSEKNLSTHELDVNPWLKFQDETNNETLMRLNSLIINLKSLKFENTSRMLANYFNKMHKHFNENQEIISRHLNGNVALDPIMSLLDTLCKI